MVSCRITVRVRVAASLFLAWTIAGNTPAEAQTGADEQRPPTWTLGSGRTFVLFPSGDIYPDYAADPHRPTSTLSLLSYSRVRIDETSSPRVTLAGGGRFGILRIDPPKTGGRAWQVSISAGVDVMFDSQHRLDAVGWDGNYGVTVTTATDGPVMLKMAVLHQSSHLGDEYQRRTGLTGAIYTREEVAAGARWRIHPRWQAYGETAVAYITRDDEQEPWRLQAGLEYESRPKVWGKRFAWYAAGDFSSMQERGWRLDEALQAGIVTRTNGRKYRLGVAWTDGRPPIGEFFKVSETWFTFGFWVEL